MRQIFAICNLRLFSDIHIYVLGIREGIACSFPIYFHLFFSHNKLRNFAMPAHSSVSSCVAIHRIGIIADVQYADIDDGWNYNKTNKRYYRNALDHLKLAIGHWQQQGVSRVLQLGDFIDGLSDKNGKRDHDFAELRKAVASFDIPWHHCIGNHDLYNFPESEMAVWQSQDAKLEKALSKNYYSFSLDESFFVIMLYAYEFAVIGKDPGDPVIEEAKKLLCKNNPNSVMTDPTGLEGTNRRWVSFNGSFGSEQLRWLESELIGAQARGQRVLIATHVPFHPNALIDAITLAWDFEDALRVVNDYNDVVFAVLSGHEHDGGMYFDEESNIVHLTMKAVLETEPSQSAFGILDLFHDHMEIKGVGLIPSITINF